MFPCWRMKKKFINQIARFFFLSMCIPKTLLSVHWNPVVLFYNQSTLLNGLLNTTNYLNCLTRAVVSLWNICLNLHNLNKTNTPSSFVVSYFNFIFSIEKDDFSKKVQSYLCSKKCKWIGSKNCSCNETVCSCILCKIVWLIFFYLAILKWEHVEWDFISLKSLD